MKKIITLILMLQLSNFVFQSANAQSFSQQLFNSITEPNSTLEFFNIKNEINISKDDFLKNYLQMLNLVPNSEMRFVRAEKDKLGFTRSRYQQYLNNKKVKGGEMIINEKEGRVKYVNGRYMINQPLNSQVLVDEETGLQTALREIKSNDYLWLNKEAEENYKIVKKNPNASMYPKGELMYIPARGTPQEQPLFQLCWRYAINVSPVSESYEIYIEATTGAIVNKIPLAFDCSAGSTTTLWNGARTIYTQLSGLSYRTIGDCNSAQIHTMNGNGNDNGVGATYYTDADNAWPNTALGNYIAQTHWSVKSTRDYYASVHTREGYDNAGHDYKSFLNPGFTGNAYWWDGTEAASFGGSSTGTSPYITLDVAGHEHTHGLVFFTSNLVYQDQPGALNESFADCMGESVEEYALGTADWIHRNEIGGGNRSFIDPKSKGQPDTYLGTNWYTGTGDAGGVHTNSGVQNYWFYLLSVGGSGTNDNGDAYSVSGITIDKARMIAYQTILNLTTNSQYSNARSVSIQAAKDLYGDCSNEVVQTTNAWRAVGVGAAYVAPAPLAISVTTSASYVCPGSPATITAFGASTYTWSNGGGSGNPKTFNPTNTTTYTVTGTNAESCTGTKSFTINVNDLPTVNPSVSDEELCPGQSTSLSAGTNGTINSFLTQLTGSSSSQGNAFDIHAYNNITITDFKMQIVSGDSAEVWYNPGGYGNANVINNTGWSKLGATVPITPAGIGNLTAIPTTSNLTISAGSTYGIIVICNGNNRYSSGTTVGAIAESNSDLYITQGHAGTGFGGSFNMTFSPRIFDGTIEYRVNYTSYLWSPASSLSSTTSSVPTASPTSTTIYTLDATDGNGCVGTGTVKVYVYPNPSITGTSATPSSICPGGTSQLNVTHSAASSAQSLFTTLNSNNGNAGNVFDIHALNTITVTNVRMNIVSGDSAEVWYKTSPYGNTSVTSSTGWTKLGNTVAITAAGTDALTIIPTTSNLVIPAGSTYGIVVVCKGLNRYTNGTALGAVAFSNPDLEITEGHGGTGFGGGFSFFASQRIFNGQIDYTVSNSITNYSWSPGGDLTNSAIQNPVADPISNTNYTVIVTDLHGCKDTAYRILYVNKPAGLTTSVSPISICPGDSAQLSVVADPNERDSLFTTLASDNSNAGNAFDIITSKAIIIRSFKTNISVGATQAEVWYNPGGYGNANFTGTVGWTKLGATVAITPAGVGNLTNIPITTSLSIASGQTYGIMIVTNGTVNYTNGLTAVGTTFVSNPDIAITVGHGGTGIGLYSFAAAPRVWNGEVTYDAVNSVSGYVWSPNTNMANSFIANPKAAPLSSTIYSVTVTDINGCSSVASAAVNVSPLPSLGTATATPATLCLGSNINLSYAGPVGTQCFGAVQSGFAGSYIPANWTLTQSPAAANGTVITGSAPNSITLTSSNGAVGGGQGTTSYTITILCSGILSFNWSYTTVDAGPQYDLPRYSINGGSGIVFPGFIGQNGASKTQNGTFNLAVAAGQTFSFQAHSSDNLGGSGSIIISNFKAPYQTTSGQSVVWFNAPGGGSNLGNGNPQSHAPAAAGTFTYYAQVTSSVTGCTNTTRVATNSVVVNPIPTLSSGLSQSRCSNVSGTYTATSATLGTTFSWTRAIVAGISNAAGSGSGAAITETLVNTTSSPVNVTYVITLLANGCSNAQNVTITVNPNPVIAGSASPGIVCPGGAVTLTGTTTGVSWNWQPGNLSGTPQVVNPIVQTTYTVTATFPTGCSTAQTFVVLMHPVPTVGTTVSPSSSICPGGSTTITGNGAVTYAWQPGGLSGTSINVSPVNTTTYTVTGTNSQGCTGIATRLITVNPLPTLNSSLTQSRCSNVSTTYTATSASPGTTFSWTRAVVAGISNVGGSGSGGVITETLINTTSNPVNVVYVITLLANGCSNMQNVTVTVNPAPVISGSASPGIVCPGGAVTLTGTTPGVTWNWQPGNLNGTPQIVHPTVQTTYTVTATGANSCTTAQTFVILMHPVPTVGTTVNPSASICGSGSVAITANGAVSYAWQPGALSGTLVNVSPISTTTYTVTGTNAQGCTGTTTRLITVNPIPILNSSLTSSRCSNVTTTYTATSATSGTTFSWTRAAVAGIANAANSGVGASITETLINNTANPVNVVYVITLLANGCSNTQNVTVTVNNCPISVLNLRALIEGFYLSANIQQPVLLNSGISVDSLNSDTIIVELHDQFNPNILIAAKVVALHTNGWSQSVFPSSLIGGSYYIVVRGRNIVETWSKQPITLGAVTSFDFSTP